MTTPDGSGEPCQESPPIGVLNGIPDVRRQGRAVPDAGPATTPGLVVSEERLADGRHITYFGVAR